MMLSSDAHTSRPWRIHEIMREFRLEDVWALPVHGGPEDFQTLLEQITAFHPSNIESGPARVLWQVRDRLGRWLRLGRISTAIENDRDVRAGELPRRRTHGTLAERLPADLRDTGAGLRFAYLPFAPLYRTEVEFAAELSNRTVHGVMHLAWVDQGGGRYRGEMAVYVKPRGRLGTGYMALIKPFRHWIVYPALMRQIERRWNARVHECAETETAPA